MLHRSSLSHNIRRQLFKKMRPFRKDAIYLINSKNEIFKKLENKNTEEIKKHKPTMIFTVIEANEKENKLTINICGATKDAPFQITNPNNHINIEIEDNKETIKIKQQSIIEHGRGIVSGPHSEMWNLNNYTDPKKFKDDFTSTTIKRCEKFRDNLMEQIYEKGIANLINQGMIAYNINKDGIGEAIFKINEHETTHNVINGMQKINIEHHLKAKEITQKNFPKLKFIEQKKEIKR